MRMKIVLCLTLILLLVNFIPKDTMTNLTTEPENTITNSIPDTAPLQDTRARTLSSNTYYQDRQISLNESIRVGLGSELLIQNCTVSMNGYFITVNEGGTLTILNSSIKPGMNKVWWIESSRGSILTIMDSSLAGYTGYIGYLETINPLIRAAHNNQTTITNTSVTSATGGAISVSSQHAIVSTVNFLERLT